MQKESHRLRRQCTGRRQLDQLEEQQTGSDHEITSQDQHPDLVQERDICRRQLAQRGHPPSVAKRPVDAFLFLRIDAAISLIGFYANGSKQAEDAAAEQQSKNLPIRDVWK